MSQIRTPSQTRTGRNTVDDLPAGVLELADRVMSQPRGCLVMSQPRDCLPCDLPLSDSTNWLSELLTAPLRLDDSWPEPPEPLAVADGWVHVDVTAEEQATFDAVAEQWQTLDAERFAAACQELRLPVCPYRPSSALASASAAEIGRTVGNDDDVSPGESPTRSVAGALVIDLTTHWAGPLATKLLAGAGATVIKLDPECRPDGFRQRPELYQHLNGQKEILDLDLRRPADRTRFETLLAKADLLVESFSRRVMPNLGYDSAQLAKLAPQLTTLSIKAFPIGTPEQDWLAFGPGVHAASGLAIRDPEPQTVPVAYPDFLTGIAGFAAAAELLTATNTSRRSAEVTLLESILPLVHTAQLERKDQR